jgi:hypothetical protein
MVGVGRFETLSLADGRRKQANVQGVLTRFPGSGVGRHRSHDQNICPGHPKNLEEHHWQRFRRRNRAAPDCTRP